ncbi:TPA: hypothetical protein LVL19_003584 [Klebsiella michiganensis]|nr:hypothetical protein [Klebsiella michiganensis]
MCSVVSVGPWTPGAGRREQSGSYLSPENAISWLTAKLAGASSDLDVVAMLLTAPTLAAFIAALSQAADVFPLPTLTQIYRRAVTASTLNESRMIKPAVAGGQFVFAPLSLTPARRAASAAGALAAAGVSSAIDPAALLSNFTARRAELLSQLSREADDIAAKSVQIYAVQSRGDVAGAIREMKENIPNPDHVFSLGLLFVGEDLSALRGGLHESDD